MRNYSLVVVAIIAFVAGAAISYYYFQSPISSASGEIFEPVSTDGLTKITPSINGTTVTLSGDCRVISFDVTVDQAYSIAKGLERSIGARPLTHDIMRDIMENFDVRIEQIKIDRYQNEIYYATIIMKQGNSILELDARPSDSIALAIRTGTTLYMRSDILEANGALVC
ncbi:MAG TPA: bifunctional nuclease family protein [archaeon]|nr:bifunctional nuclease family protein [archaeon]